MKNAIVLTDGLLMTSDAKTAHGLIRGTERFNIIGLVDGEGLPKVLTCLLSSLLGKGYWKC